MPQSHAKKLSVKQARGTPLLARTDLNPCVLLTGLVEKKVKISKSVELIHPARDSNKVFPIKFNNKLISDKSPSVARYVAPIKFFNKS